MRNDGVIEYRGYTLELCNEREGFYCTIWKNGEEVESSDQTPTPEEAIQSAMETVDIRKPQ